MGKLCFFYKQFGTNQKSLGRVNSDYTAYTISLLTPRIHTTVQYQADILGEYFFQVSSSSEYNATFHSCKSITEKQYLPTKGGMKEDYNNLFTIEGLWNTLSTQTALGLDNNASTLILNCSKYFTQFL